MRKKLESAIDLLNTELRHTARPPLRSSDYAALRDPQQYRKAVEILDSLEFRGAISSHVRGEVADALLAPFSTLAEIQAAVRAGRRVHWKNEGYTVGRWVWKDGTEQWSVVFHTGDCVGLSPSEHRASDFFFGE